MVKMGKPITKQGENSNIRTGDSKPRPTENPQKPTVGGSSKPTGGRK